MKAVEQHSALHKSASQFSRGDAAETRREVVLNVILKSGGTLCIVSSLHFKTK